MQITFMPKDSFKCLHSNLNMFDVVTVPDNSRQGYILEAIICVIHSICTTINGLPLLPKNKCMKGSI